LAQMPALALLVLVGGRPRRERANEFAALGGEQGEDTNPVKPD
jgi:hypothetical protein